jgi:hypothetical protein
MVPTIGSPLAAARLGAAIPYAFMRTPLLASAAALTAAVPEERIDQIAIACRLDEAVDRLRQWDGLTDLVLFYSPSVGVAPARVRENLAAIAETFGSGSLAR